MIHLSKKKVLACVIFIAIIITWVTVDGMLREMEVNEFTLQRYGVEISMVKDNCHFKTKTQMLEVMQRDGVCAFSTHTVTEIAETNMYRILQANVLLDSAYNPEDNAMRTPVHFVEFDRATFQLEQIYDYSFITHR